MNHTGELRARALKILDESVPIPTIHAHLHRVLSEPGKVLALPESAIFSWSLAIINIAAIVGTVTKASLDCAIAVDFFSTSADIFDDLADQDGSNEYWNQLPTAEQLSLALLLWQLSQNLLLNLQMDPATLSQVSLLFHKYATQSCIGQSKDVFGIKPGSLDDCFQSTSQKSGTLLALCCALAAITAGAEAETVSSLSEIGRTVGLINQLVNDVNAIKEPSKKSDIRYRKITLPVAYCLYNSSGKQNPTVSRYYLEAASNACPGDIAEQIVSEGGVIYTLTVANHLKQQLLDQIRQLPLSTDGRDTLVDIFFPRKTN